MQKKSLKSITLTRLVQVFLLAIITIIIVMFLAYKEFFKYTVESKALEISTVVKAGLTSHMKAGVMQKRDYFLREIKNIKNINSIHIVRSPLLEKQFGISSFEIDKNFKPLKNLVTLDKAYFEWNTKEGIVDAIIPYKASSQGELNCLECHNVKDGDTLGALEIEMDITSYQALITEYSYLFVGMLLFFALLIMLNLFNFIEKYISKPLRNIVRDGEEAYNKNIEIDTKNYKLKELECLAKNLNNFNKDVLLKERELQLKNRELKELNIEIESTLKETMMAMGQVEEIRSSDTKNHTKRVAILSALIAKEYGLSSEEVALIELTAPLHDIGKVGISDDILLKPAKLTEDEYERMKDHAILGYNVLKHSGREVLKSAAQIAHYHHEKWDGSGYPEGLKGEEIPLFARIVAIVDVLDALLCKRIYKDAWSTRDVYEHMQNQRGEHFDPRLVEIVLENFESYVKIVEDMSVTEG